MSKYLTANHTIQGGRIATPQTNMGQGSRARFHYAPDRLTVTFDMVGMTSTLSNALGEQASEAPAIDEFYARIRNMLQMVTRGMAIMKADGAALSFLTTMNDANKYQEQRETIAAACGMGNTCEDCPLSTRCPDLQ